MNILEAHTNEGKRIHKLVMKDLWITANSYSAGYGHIGDITPYNEPGLGGYYTWFQFVNGNGEEFRINSIYVHAVEFK